MFASIIAAVVGVTTRFLMKSAGELLTYVNSRTYNVDTGKECRAVPSQCREEHPVAPLADPDRLQAYRDALCNWRTTDYIQFHLNEAADRFIRIKLDNIPRDDIRKRMYEHVVNEGGEVDEQREERSPWSDEFEFHHDLRLTIRDKRVYIETRLHYWRPFVPDQSWIDVVNIHAP
jgi:hypothetical protein